MIFKEVYDEQGRFVALKAYPSDAFPSTEGIDLPLKSYIFSYVYVREFYKSRGKMMGLEAIVRREHPRDKPQDSCPYGYYKNL